MRGVVRVLVLAASMTWLAGCETTGLKMPWAAKDEEPPAPNSAPNEVTGSIAGQPGGPVAVIDGHSPASTGLTGEAPADDLNLGKRYYRENQFGVAEQHFRRSVERNPKDLESWIGLAASYDKLKRFDLADRAYKQAIALAGPTPEILNNQGYSYLLRGDRRRARQVLLAAQAKDPGNPYIKNNLDMLDESFVKRKDVQ